MPMTATVSIGLDRRAGVTQFEGEAVIGRGTADMPGGRFSLDGGRVHGRYDIDTDELIFDNWRWRATAPASTAKCACAMCPRSWPPRRISRRRSTSHCRR
ncbi:MAG: hypothetical protein R3C16_08930 [Hyphomonadaceae bacterium]